MMTVEKYHEALKKFAPKQGLILNPDWDIVKPLLEGLLTNGERYGLRTCPCRLAAGNNEKDKDTLLFYFFTISFSTLPARSIAVFSASFILNNCIFNVLRDAGVAIIVSSPMKTC